MQKASKCGCAPCLKLGPLSKRGRQNKTPPLSVSRFHGKTTHATGGNVTGKCELPSRMMLRPAVRPTLMSKTFWRGSFQARQSLSSSGRPDDGKAPVRKSLVRKTYSQSPIDSHTSNNLQQVEPVITNIDGFKTLVQEGNARLEDAKSYLSRSKAETERLPLFQRRLAAAQVGAGYVLLWLLDDSEKILRVSQDFREELANPLCWFLCAEGNEEYLWEWIKIDTQRSRASSQRHSFQLTRGAEIKVAHAPWRGSVLAR